jgi:hypothetical protein
MTQLVEHIRQRGRHDCGIAAIAMFTGKTYEEVLAVASKDADAYRKKGGTYCVARIIDNLGFFWDNLGRHKDHPAPFPDGRPFQSVGLRWANGVIAPQFYRKFFWGRPTLLSIVSLNHPPNGRHLVYYDGRRIYDPQEGRRGKKFATSLDQVDIDEAYIWLHD